MKTLSDRSRRWPIVMVALAGVMAILPVTGCDDDGTGPEPLFAIETIWPHEDGDSWTFDLALAERDWQQEPFTTPGEVPDLPAVDVLWEQFQEPLPGAASESVTGTFRLAFDGEITTGSGVTVQHLAETLLPETERSRAAVTSGHALPGWLRTLAAARPDLRDRIARRYDLDVSALAAAKDLNLFEPIFLSGYAWQQTADGIFGYGDLSTEPSWIYLTDDLQEGASFSLQLVPGLADDVYLYGRVVFRGQKVVAGQVFLNVMQCFYVLDMGVGSLTDENGHHLGSVRMYMVGLVTYVPGLGPVRSHDRRYVMTGGIVDQTETALVVYELKAGLSGSTVGAER